MHRIETVVAATQPFAFRKSLDFLIGFPPCAGDQHLTTDATTGVASVTKGVSFGGQAMAVRLGEHADGVQVIALSEQLLPTSATRRLHRWTTDLFSLDEDLGEFYALAASDRPFSAVTQSLHGLHHVRFPSVAEAAVWFVLTQRTPQRIALNLKRRITTELGRSTLVDGVRHQAFPELDDLTGLNAADWQILIGNERKARYLDNVLHGVADLGVDWLGHAPYDEATTALRRIVGVGEFTAAAILLRGLGRMDFVPLGMPSFDRPARALYGSGFDPDRIRRHYGRHLGYWAYYLKTSSDAIRPSSASACTVAAA